MALERHPRLGPAPKPSRRVLDTLRKINGGWRMFFIPRLRQVGLMNVEMDVEPISDRRLQFMISSGFVAERRNTPFAQLGWIEYEITEDGRAHLRKHH